MVPSLSTCRRRSLEQYSGFNKVKCKLTHSCKSTQTCSSATLDRTLCSMFSSLSHLSLAGVLPTVSNDKWLIWLAQFSKTIVILCWLRECFLANIRLALYLLYWGHLKTEHDEDGDGKTYNILAVGRCISVMVHDVIRNICFIAEA